MYSLYFIEERNKCEKKRVLYERLHLHYKDVRLQCNSLNRDSYPEAKSVSDDCVYCHKRLRFPLQDNGFIGKTVKDYCIWDKVQILLFVRFAV
jgi:hypothetical protein